VTEKKQPPKLQPDFSGLDLDQTSALLSSRRTQLSLHRTRMSADRTLMSVVRTSLSLIGFGFTIFQFFRTLKQSIETAPKVAGASPRAFGITLVLLGVGTLALGIWNHLHFMWHLRKTRNELADAGLIEKQDTFPVSTTLVVATALLIAGIVAYFDMMSRAAGS